MEVYNQEVQDIVPSIEDKIKKFTDRSRHQIFLEPETKCGEIIYP